MCLPDGLNELFEIVRFERTEESYDIWLDEKKKLSFKEKREFEELDALIPQLEEEKANLENELSSGTLSTDELLQKSNRISQLIEAIEEKTMRWLELSELA